MLISDITLANPALPQGGLPFSPKDEIQDLFSDVLPYKKIPHRWSLEEKLQASKEFAKAYGYPVIVKPNSGHRGIDVHLARNEQDLRQTFTRQTWDFMLQQFSDDPEEYGVFYSRRPGEEEGKIVSLTRKVIPTLVGDGKSTIDELIATRPELNQSAIRDALSHRLREVPEFGIRIKTLVGASHSRGCIFLDASNLETPELRQKVLEVCDIEGFYFGRLDVKAKSIDDFQAGKFQIIEINGATSEMIHVYDTRISLLEGLRVLKYQWSLLFEIAHMCKGRSAKIPLLRFIGMYRKFYVSTKQAIGQLW